MASITFRQVAGIGRATALIMAGVFFPLVPLAAQQPEPRPQGGDEIVVTGTRDQDRAIRDYVKGLTVLVSTDPLARYEPGVYCPAVVGLTVARNRQIAERMRAVAAAAGIKPAAQGCRPSALVIFVDDKESFLKIFRATHPVYFANPNAGEDWSPSKGKGPDVAWRLVQQLDSDRLPLQRDSQFGIAQVSSTTRGSRILAMFQTAVAMSVVIVERQALRGLTATQIADYALMRTLTDPAAAGPQAPNQFTILQALEAPMGSAVPRSLTQWDLAYLKGRYSGHPAQYGGSQRAAIQRSIKRVVKAERQE